VLLPVSQAMGEQQPELLHLQLRQWQVLVMMIGW
jgi:hypothetical protein